jgi:hypothetical protein
MDEHEGYNGFDGEDSWQIVEAWGNSDSPAMAEHDVADYEEMGIESGEPDGYVEDLESFLATDMTGTQRFFYRNRAYDEFMHSEEEQSAD